MRKTTARPGAAYGHQAIIRKGDLTMSEKHDEYTFFITDKTYVITQNISYYYFVESDSRFYRVQKSTLYDGEYRRDTFGNICLDSHPVMRLIRSNPASAEIARKEAQRLNDEEKTRIK
jgi:hypothetical protein